VVQSQSWRLETSSSSRLTQSRSSCQNAGSVVGSAAASVNSARPKVGGAQPNRMSKYRPKPQAVSGSRAMMIGPMTGILGLGSGAVAGSPESSSLTSLV